MPQADVPNLADAYMQTLGSFKVPIVLYIVESISITIV